MGASWKGAWDRVGKWGRLGTKGMADRSDISGNSAKTAICSFWERLASAKSCVWSQLARICRVGTLDMLDMGGKLERVTVWLSKLGGVKVVGASQGDQLSHLILLFVWRRQASGLVSFDPFGQLHIESFMGWEEGGCNAGRKERKARVGKNLLSSSQWSGDK